MFEWNEKYKVGDNEVDKQYQELFKLGERLSKSSYNEFQQCLMEFFVYTRNHFSKEEKIMEERGFHDIERHKMLHKKCIDYIDTFIDKKELTENDHINFTQFVFCWLQEHITKEDIK